MQGAHRTVMAGVHRLQEIEGLRSSNLADDDAFRPHAQAVPDQVAHRDLADAFEIRRPRLEPNDMGLLELELGGVLAGDDSLVDVDVVRQAVQKRRLAGAGAARNEDVAADAADDLENFGAGRGDRAKPNQLIEGQLVAPELADRQRRAVDRQRRRDDVDARAVEQAGVADRRSFVDPASDLAHDPLADVHQLRAVAETDIGQLDLAADFDEASRRSIDHDVGDVVAREQRLERTEAEDVVADIVEQIFLLGDRQHQVLDRDDLVHDVPNLLPRAFGIEFGQRGEIDRLDQRAEDQGLGLKIGLRSPFGLNRRARGLLGLGRLGDGGRRGDA